MSPRTRGVLVVVAVLAGVGVLAGVVGGLVVGGLVNSVQVEAPALPPPRASSGPSGHPAGVAQGGGASPSASVPPGGAGTGSPDALGGPLTLAGPAAAPAGGRVDLTGRYAGAAPGTVLQIQQRLAGEDWSDFPVQVSTGADGAFRTWIITSRVGAQQFRVLDTRSGTASPPVDVTIS